MKNKIGRNSQTNLQLSSNDKVLQEIKDNDITVTKLKDVPSRNKMKVVRLSKSVPRGGRKNEILPVQPPSPQLSLAESAVQKDLITQYNQTAMFYINRKQPAEALEILTLCQQILERNPCQVTDSISVRKLVKKQQFQTYSNMADCHNISGNMILSLEFLKKSLDAIQDSHALNPELDLWENGLSIYNWPARGICETMHNLTNCINYFGKRKEALIYAIQARMWASDILENLKQTLMFRSKMLQVQDEKKFFNYSQTYFDLVILYGLTLQNNAITLSSMCHFDDSNQHFNFAKIILSANFQDLTQAELGPDREYFNETRLFIEKSLFSLKPYNLQSATKLYKQLAKEHNQNKLAQNYMNSQGKINSWLKSQQMGYLNREIEWITRDFIKPNPVVLNSGDSVNFVFPQSNAEFDMPSVLQKLKNARLRRNMSPYKNYSPMRKSAASTQASGFRSTTNTTSSNFFHKRNSRSTSKNPISFSYPSNAAWDQSSVQRSASKPRINFSTSVTYSTSFQNRIQHLIDVRSQSDLIIQKQLEKIEKIKQKITNKSVNLILEQEFQQIKNYQRHLKKQHQNVIENLKRAQYEEIKNDVNYEIMNKKYQNFKELQEQQNNEQLEQLDKLQQILEKQNLDIQKQQLNFDTEQLSEQVDEIKKMQENLDELKQVASTRNKVDQSIQAAYYQEQPIITSYQQEPANDSLISEAPKKSTVVTEPPIPEDDSYEKIIVEKPVDSRILIKDVQQYNQYINQQQKFKIYIQYTDNLTIKIFIENYEQYEVVGQPQTTVYQILVETSQTGDLNQALELFLKEIKEKVQEIEMESFPYTEHMECIKNVVREAFKVNEKQVNFREDTFNSKDSLMQPSKLSIKSNKHINDSILKQNTMSYKKQSFGQQSSYKNNTQESRRSTMKSRRSEKDTLESFVDLELTNIKVLLQPKKKAPVKKVDKKEEVLKRESTIKSVKSNKNTHRAQLPAQVKKQTPTSKQSDVQIDSSKLVSPKNKVIPAPEEEEIPKQPENIKSDAFEINICQSFRIDVTQEVDGDITHEVDGPDDGDLVKFQPMTPTSMSSSDFFSSACDDSQISQYDENGLKVQYSIFNAKFTNFIGKLDECLKEEEVQMENRNKEAIKEKMRLYFKDKM